jgi:hypothetical protein
MNSTDLDFLFKDQKNNSITIIHNRSVSGLTPSVKGEFERLYKSYVNDSVHFDWNCASCIIEVLTRLYIHAADAATNSGYVAEQATTEDITSTIEGAIAGEVSEQEEQAPKKKKK